MHSLQYSLTNSWRPRKISVGVLLNVLIFLCANGAQAQIKTSNKTENYTHASAMITGTIGLNTIPSSRMLESGSITSGVSTLDPYLHGYIGVQIADPLFINIRQTAEISNINKDADRLYPGVDLKLRIAEESRRTPEIAIGLQSAIGHKRMAAEYILASKRHDNFDFTAGIGWGRFATASHFKNPLGLLSTHFDKTRTSDGEMPNSAQNWFTGEHIGLFGGVEYFTPLKGLSLKFDYGADRYSAEKAALNYNAPAPYALGLSYSPKPWINGQIGFQGTDKVLARLSLTGNIKNWRDREKHAKKPIHIRPYRTGLTLPARIEQSAHAQGDIIYNTDANLKTVRTHLLLNPASPFPAQMANAIPHLANHAGPSIEQFEITPTQMGLKGAPIRLIRKDIENAASNRASAGEIWQNMSIQKPDEWNWSKLKRPTEIFYGIDQTKFILENQISPAEEDSGILYRSAFLMQSRGPSLFGLLDSGASLRLNLGDNLNRLTDIRPQNLLPVRADVDRFAERTIALENAYTTFTHSPRSDVHIMASAGYLEEMYAGIGGEILYRPFKSRLSYGFESWQAFKRDPYTALNMGLNGDHILTAHGSIWYDIPRHDITAQIKAGRYLAQDIGTTLSLSKSFQNGAKLEAFTTLSNYADFDLFGGTTHSDHGLRLSLPLGGFKNVPQNAYIITSIRPFGRDIGQSIIAPENLYDLTAPFSYNHLSKNWNKITPE